MNELKKVKYLRPVDPVPKDLTVANEVDDNMQLADEFFGTLCGFCEQEGEIKAIVADEKTGKFLSLCLDEISLTE